MLLNQIIDEPEEEGQVPTIGTLPNAAAPSNPHLSSLDLRQRNPMPSPRKWKFEA